MEEKEESVEEEGYEGYECRCEYVSGPFSRERYETEFGLLIGILIILE